MPKKTKEKDTIKYINFDLKIEAIKEAIAKGEVRFKVYTSAYGNIRTWLKRANFEHDQGSVYKSKVSMSVLDVQNIFLKLGKERPWLASCVRKCHLSSVEAGAIKETDLTPDIQSGAEFAKSQDDGLASSPSEYKATKDPNGETKKSSPKYKDDDERSM
jgi:virulence-associated protein VapD